MQNIITTVAPSTTQTQDWYMSLIKPEWAPAPEVFGKVWSVLYIMIAVAFIYTCYKTFGKGASAASPAKLWPKYIFYIFVFNLFVNIIYSPIQFGLQNNYLATADILLVLGSCFALVFSLFKYSKWTALLLVPYTVWVCIATTLQISILFLNM